MGLKTLVALVLYCLLFSVCFAVLYPLLLDDRRVVEPVMAEVGDGRAGKAAHVPNAVEQRQVLGLYEDSQSQNESPQDLPLQRCVCYTFRLLWEVS